MIIVQRAAVTWWEQYNLYFAISITDRKNFKTPITHRPDCFYTEDFSDYKPSRFLFQYEEPNENNDCVSR